MKSAVLKKPGSIVIENRERPIPSQGECLMRILSAGVCNSDIFRSHGGAYFHPLVMGHEIFGEVIECGPGIKELKPGQRAVIFPLLPCGACEACSNHQWIHCRDYDYYGSRRDGGFQEYLTVKEWNLLKAPVDLNPILGCLTEPVAVAVHTTSRVKEAEPRQQACVVGAGLIGLCIAKALQKKGWIVTVIDRNAFKLDLAKVIGLSSEHTIKVRELYASFHLVVEATGSRDMFESSLHLAKPSGKVFWIGNIQSDLVLPKSIVSMILRKELSIQGVWNSDYQRGKGDDWDSALTLIGKSSWLKKFITHRIRLEELPAMLSRMHTIKKAHAPHDMLKVIVDMMA